MREKRRGERAQGSRHAGPTQGVPWGPVGCEGSHCAHGCVDGHVDGGEDSQHSTQQRAQQQQSVEQHGRRGPRGMLTPHLYLHGV